MSSVRSASSVGPNRMQRLTAVVTPSGPQSWRSSWSARLITPRSAPSVRLRWTYHWYFSRFAKMAGCGCAMGTDPHCGSRMLAVLLGQANRHRQVLAPAWQPSGMRIVVFGAGAVGGVIGGRLFQHADRHGHDVSLVARGAHLRRHPAQRASHQRSPTATWWSRPTGRRPHRRWSSWSRRRRRAGHEDAGHAGRARRRSRDHAPARRHRGLRAERRRERAARAPAVRRTSTASASCCRRPSWSPASSTPTVTPHNAILDVGRYPSGVDPTAAAPRGRVRGQRPVEPARRRRSCGSSTASSS